MTLPPHIAAGIARLGVVAPPPVRQPVAPAWKPATPQEECPW